MGEVLKNTSSVEKHFRVWTQSKIQVRRYQPCSRRSSRALRISYGRLVVSVLQKHPGHCLVASQASIALTRLSLEIHEHSSTAGQASIAPVELSAYSHSQYFDISFYLSFSFSFFGISFCFRQFLWLVSGEAYYGFGDSSGIEARCKIFTYHSFSWKIWMTQDRGLGTVEKIDQITHHPTNKQRPQILWGHPKP